MCAGESPPSKNETRWLVSSSTTQIRSKSSWYELAAVPQTLLIDRAPRRRAAQHERHVRRLKERRRRVDQ
jgi:hypothetical protein